MKTKPTVLSFFINLAAAAALAAGALFSTGAGAAEATLSFKAQVLEKDSLYKDYTVTADCAWNFADVDPVKNAVHGAECDVRFIPPAQKNSVPIPYPTIAVIHWSPEIRIVNADSVIKLDFPPIKFKRSKVPPLTVTVTMAQANWQFSNGTEDPNLPLGADTADTRGLCLSLKGAEEACSIDRAAASQECLIYDVSGPTVYQG
jgi:hypothetical protein